MAKLTWPLNLCSIYHRRVLCSALCLTCSSILYAVQCFWLVLLLFQSAHFKGSKQHKVRRKAAQGNCWLFKQCYFFLIKCHMNLELLSNKRSSVPLRIYNSSVPHSQLKLKREGPSINCRCTHERNLHSIKTTHFSFPDQITCTSLKLTL